MYVATFNAYSGRKKTTLYGARQMDGRLKTAGSAYQLHLTQPIALTATQSSPIDPQIQETLSAHSISINPKSKLGTGKHEPRCWSGHPANRDFSLTFPTAEANKLEHANMYWPQLILVWLKILHEQLCHICLKPLICLKLLNIARHTKIWLSIRAYGDLLMTC